MTDFAGGSFVVFAVVLLVAFDDFDAVLVVIFDFVLVVVVVVC